MSDRPWEEVHEGLDEVTAAARSLGCAIDSPFMILSFVGLAGVPDYGLTEKGLIDAFTQTFLPVLVCCRCPTHVGTDPAPPTRTGTRSVRFERQPLEGEGDLDLA